ncbi:MAG: hypothetical protein KAJ51_01555, partial [Thermoplasmata archaeon]|nr:hypothetical protein [Thermoplasmata archaeon]
NAEKNYHILKQGDSAEVNLTVENWGNTIDIFKIEYSSAKLQSQLDIDKSNIQLGPGNDSNIKLSITIPEIFELGLYHITVTATSLSDVTVSDEDSIDIDVIKDGGDSNDTDGDGLPDDWELEHGLDLNDPNDALLDPDGDTLMNRQEFENGTNPHQKDTDGDGIPDDWEIEYGFKPTDPADAQLDSDGDSLSNFNEYQIDTNPLEKDTDGDGYPDNIDDFPNDFNKYQEKITDDNAILESYLLILIAIIIVIILIVLITVVYKKRRQIGDLSFKSSEQFNERQEIQNEVALKEVHPSIILDNESDKIIDELQNEAIAVKTPIDFDLTDQELLAQFETKYRDGKISEDTYNLIQEKLGGK